VNDHRRGEHQIQQLDRPCDAIVRAPAQGDDCAGADERDDQVVEGSEDPVERRQRLRTAAGIEECRPEEAVLHRIDDDAGALDLVELPERHPLPDQLPAEVRPRIGADATPGLGQRRGRGGRELAEAPVGQEGEAARRVAVTQVGVERGGERLAQIRIGGRPVRRHLVLAQVPGGDDRRRHGGEHQRGAPPLRASSAGGQVHGGHDDHRRGEAAHQGEVAAEQPGGRGARRGRALELPRERQQCQEQQHGERDLGDQEGAGGDEDGAAGRQHARAPGGRGRHDATAEDDDEERKGRTDQDLCGHGPLDRAPEGRAGRPLDADEEGSEQQGVARGPAHVGLHGRQRRGGVRAAAREVEREHDVTERITLERLARLDPGQEREAEAEGEKEQRRKAEVVCAGCPHYGARTVGHRGTVVSSGRARAERASVVP
jgi:hypothetical protein